MKKTIMIVILSGFLLAILFYVLLLTIILNGPGTNDWHYKLPNGYEIWHVNSREIICGKLETDSSLFTVIGEQIIEFSYNERYISIKRVEVPEDISIEIDIKNPEYYIINTAEDLKYGPFIKKDYEEKIQILNIKDLGNWITTKQRPDGAEIGK